MSTEVNELKKLLASDLGPAVAQETIQVLVSSDGTVHGAGADTCGPGRRYPAFEDAPAPVPARVRVQYPLADFVGAEICSSCKYSLVGWHSGWTRNAPVEAALELYRYQVRLRGMVKVTAKTSASAVQMRLTDLPHIVRQLEAGWSNHSKLHQDFADRLLLEASKAEEVLRKAASGDDSRRKLEVKLKAVMLPKRFAGQDVALDASPLMIGISPAPSYVRNPLVKAALDAYAIRQDKVAVLVAPAFVYAFLLQQLFPKATSTVLVVSTPAPVEAEVREVVAGLWDPEGEGALACIQATIDAARSI